MKTYKSYPMFCYKCLNGTIYHNALKRDKHLLECSKSKEIDKNSNCKNYKDK